MRSVNGLALRYCAVAAAVAILGTTAFFFAGRRAAGAADLTGNWAVKTARNDGTFSKAYFNLKQDGDKLSGTVRTTQFYYKITESSVTSEGFTFTASMKDGNSDRSVKYEGHLVGEELH